MSVRWGPGPVFYFEWLTSSRRWQMYAARSLFVLLLLTALFIVWCTEAQSFSVTANVSAYRKALADMGEKFFYAVIGTQLTLVLLIAPAMTAGAVCIDKARGTLLHLLATDLTNTEIILGKLGTRFVALFGLVLCTAPVLFLCTLEGGIDPDALFGAFLITLGVAVFTGTLALTLSVWCSKTYEVLLATYLISFILLLVNPILRYWGLKVAPPFWVEALNIYWLAFGPYWSPGAITVEDDLGFLIGCTALAAILVALAVWRVRAVAIHQSSKLMKARGRLLRFLDLTVLMRLLPGLSLDFNPVLWREWHRRRPSRWVGGVWLIYVLLAGFFTVIAAVQYLRHQSQGELGPFVNAFQVSLGLLLVSIASVTSLSEERIHGTMDLLLATTIPTWKIVWRKWWGTYRTVILLTFFPGAIAFAIALRHDILEGRVPEVWPGIYLIIALILAWGAAVTSFGLALATWIRRPGRALALSVITYVAMTVGWIVLFLLLQRNMGNRLAEGLVLASPWYGSGALTAHMEHRFQFPGDWSPFVWGVLWVFIYTGVAVTFFVLTLLTFNACLGRMPLYPSQVRDAIRPNLGGTAPVRSATRRTVPPT